MKWKLLLLPAAILGMLAEGCFSTPETDEPVPKPVPSKDYLDELITSLEKTAPASSPELKNMKELRVALKDSPWTGHPIACFSLDPFSPRAFLPAGELPPERPDNSLLITAARGETESCSFAIYSFKDYSSVRIEAEDFSSKGKDRIPVSAMDIRIVTCRWKEQTAWNSPLANPSTRILVPELLLHDETLLKINPDKKENYLRIDYPSGSKYVWITYPREADPGAFDPLRNPYSDADELQPFSLKEGLGKQFWITVSVPEDAHPGRYQSTLRIIADQTDILGTLHLTLNVLPFTLPPAGTYRDPGKRFTVRCEAFLPDVSAPSGLQALQDPEAFAERLQILKKRNITELPPLDVSSGKSLSSTSDILKQENRLLKKQGFPPRQLRQPADEQITEELCPRSIRNAHAIGDTILLQVPFTGPVDPASMRRKLGMIPYKADADGIVLLLQETEPGTDPGSRSSHPLNAFFYSPPEYPASGGATLETLHAEALREAVDDVRYATLLRLAAAEAMKQDRTRPLAREALRLLAEFDERKDHPDTLRQRVIRYLLKLDAERKG